MTIPEFEHVAEVSPSTDGTGIIGVKWNTSLNGKLPCSLMYGDKLFTADQLQQALEAMQRELDAAKKEIRELNLANAGLCKSNFQYMKSAAKLKAKLDAAKDAEIERLVLAIADHVTVRSEQHALLLKQSEALKLAKDAVTASLKVIQADSEEFVLQADFLIARTEALGKLETALAAINALEK